MSSSKFIPDHDNPSEKRGGRISRKPRKPNTRTILKSRNAASKKKKVYQAKFIEIDDLNQMRHWIYNDAYMAAVNKYKPSKKNGINVGDILYFSGDEVKDCFFVALPGKVQWLGDDGDTPEFVLSLNDNAKLLDKYNVKYDTLFANRSYIKMSHNVAKKINKPISEIPDYLLGGLVEIDTPKNIIDSLRKAGRIN